MKTMFKDALFVAVAGLALAALMLCPVAYVRGAELLSNTYQLPLWHEDLPLEVRTLGEHESMALKIINRRGGSAVCGSGGLIDAAGDCGLVLSCGHLFPYIGQIEVVTPDGRRFEGVLVDVDRAVDLSLIAICTDSDMKLTPLAEETPLRGEEIVTAGYGWGKLREMRARVTGWNKSGRRWDMHGDRPLRSGDSGSLVWNKSGEVVGIGWGTSGGGLYAVGLPTIYEFIERPKVVAYCGLFKNRPRRGKGCGPFNCKPRSPPDAEAPTDTPPRRPAKPRPEPDRKAPKPDNIPIAGPPGPAGPAGPPGRDADLSPVLARLERLQAKVDAITDQKPHPVDLGPILARLESLEKPKPADLLPIQKQTKISHFVLVSYLDQPGWQQINGIMGEAKKIHPFIRVKDAGELRFKVNGPSLWTYNLDGDEVAVDQGYNEVYAALQGIASGRFKQ